MTLITMWKRAIAGPAAAILLLSGLNASSATGDERPGREPGLPFMECIGYPSTPCTPPDSPVVNDYGWTNAAQLGLTGSVGAKQWARIPMTMAAAVGEYGFEFHDGPWVSNQTIDLRVRAIFTSPADSANNYGDSPHITVRTVAFGSIPAEVTLQVGQARDSGNLPVPFEFVLRSRKINYPRDRPDLEAIYVLEESPQPLAADVEVRVTRLRLDGVDVSLRPGCTTGARAQLSLNYKEVTVEAPRGTTRDLVLEQTHPDTHFYLSYGGSLHGAIDIPAFFGCVTSAGDDISRILTSAISADGNPVTAKVGKLGCILVGEDGRTAPNPPGVTSPFDPRSGCDPTDQQGNYNLVPTPLPFPDYAPGAPAP